MHISGKAHTRSMPRTAPLLVHHHACRAHAPRRDYLPRYSLYYARPAGASLLPTHYPAFRGLPSALTYAPACWHAAGQRYGSPRAVVTPVGAPATYYTGTDLTFVPSFACQRPLPASQRYECRSTLLPLVGPSCCYSGSDGFSSVTAIYFYQSGWRSLLPACGCQPVWDCTAATMPHYRPAASTVGFYQHHARTPAGSPTPSWTNSSPLLTRILTPAIVVGSFMGRAFTALPTLPRTPLRAPLSAPGLRHLPETPSALP